MANTISIYIKAYGSQARKELTDTESGIKSLGNTASALGGRLTLFGGLGVTAFALAGRAAVKSAGEIEQAKIAYESLLGSADAAKATLKALYDFAARTPFEFGDVKTLGAQLLGAGFAANDLIPTLTKLGDAAASVGVGTEGLQSVVRALAQMRGKPNVQMEEILQISEALPGIPILDMLAQKFKLTAEQMNNLGAAHIPAEEAIKTIVDGLGKRAPDAMDKMSKSLTGIASTLHDTIQSFITDVDGSGIGDKILQNLKQPVLDALAALNQMKKDGSLKPLAREIGQAVGEMAKALSNLIQYLSKHPELAAFALKTAAIGTAASITLGPILQLAGGAAQAVASIAMWRIGMAAAAATATASTGATVGLGASIAAIGGPITIAIAAIAAMAFAWKNNLFHMQSQWYYFRREILHETMNPMDNPEWDTARIRQFKWVKSEAAKRFPIKNTRTLTKVYVAGGTPTTGDIDGTGGGVTTAGGYEDRPVFTDVNDAARNKWIKESGYKAYLNARKRNELARVPKTTPLPGAKKRFTLPKSADTKAADAAAKAAETWAADRADLARLSDEERLNILGLDTTPMGKLHFQNESARSQAGRKIGDINEKGGDFAAALGVQVGLTKQLAANWSAYWTEVGKYNDEALKGILDEGDAHDEVARENKDRLASEAKDSEDRHQKALDWIQQERQAQSAAFDAVIAMERRKLELSIEEAMRGGALTDDQVDGYKAQAAALWDVVIAAKEREATELRTRALILLWMGPAGAMGAAKLQQEADALHLEALGLGLDRTEDLRKLVMNFAIRRLEIEKGILLVELAKTTEAKEQLRIKNLIAGIDAKIAGINDPGMPVPGQVPEKADKRSKREDWQKDWNERGNIADKAGEQIVDNFASRFADMMTGTKDAWKGLWASLTDTFKSALKDLIAAWLKSQIAKALFGGGGVPGTGGAASAAAGIAGAIAPGGPAASIVGGPGSGGPMAQGGGVPGGLFNGKGGIFGNIGKLLGKKIGASTLGGGLMAGLAGALIAPMLFGKDNQSGIGGGLGSMAGMLLGGPLGALGGGLLGGWIGSWFKKKKKSNLSFSMPSITAPNTYALSNSTGSNTSAASGSSSQGQYAGAGVQVNQTIHNYMPRPIAGLSQDLADSVSRAVKGR